MLSELEFICQKWFCSFWGERSGCGSQSLCREGRQGAHGIVAGDLISQFLLTIFFPTHLSSVPSFLAKPPKQAEVGEVAGAPDSGLTHDISLPFHVSIPVTHFSPRLLKVPEWGAGLIPSVSVWFTALRKTASLAPIRTVFRLPESTASFIPVSFHDGESGISVADRSLFLRPAVFPEANIIIRGNIHSVMCLPRWLIWTFCAPSGYLKSVLSFCLVIGWLLDA